MCGQGASEVNQLSVRCRLKVRYWYWFSKGLAGGQLECKIGKKMVSFWAGRIWIINIHHGTSNLTMRSQMYSIKLTVEMRNRIDIKLQRKPNKWKMSAHSTPFNSKQSIVTRIRSGVWIAHNTNIRMNSVYRMQGDLQKCGERMIKHQNIQQSLLIIDSLYYSLSPLIYLQRVQNLNTLFHDYVKIQSTKFKSNRINIWTEKIQDVEFLNIFQNESSSKPGE